MESFISTFHIDWKIIIAQAINFIIILAVLYLLALKPLKKVMSERQDKIEGGLKDAIKNAEILAQSQKEYEQTVSKARAEAHNIFQEGKKEAEANKADMLRKATLEVDNMIESGKKRLEGMKVEMIEEAKKEIVSLVVKATEKLLESHDDASFNDKAIHTIHKI
jgi:F-type H+-transporting ATPase subunit b